MNLHTIINQPSTVLIDVRETFEFSMGHTPGAINFPLSVLPHRIHELKDLEGPLVLYCRSGNRSGMAVEFLKSKGFRDVYNGGSLEDVAYARKKAA